MSLIDTRGDRCRPKQLDTVVAIGDLYGFDRFAAPAALWDDLQGPLSGAAERGQIATW